MGIEPIAQVWKTWVLPLYEARKRYVEARKGIAEASTPQDRRVHLDVAM